MGKSNCRRTAPIWLTEESTLDTLLPLIPVLRRPGLERVQLEVMKAFPMMRGEGGEW